MSSDTSIFDQNIFEVENGAFRDVPRHSLFSVKYLHQTDSCSEHTPPNHVFVRRQNVLSIVESLSSRGLASLGVENEVLVISYMDDNQNIETMSECDIAQRTSFAHAIKDIGGGNVVRDEIGYSLIVVLRDREMNRLTLENLCGFGLITLSVKEKEYSRVFLSVLAKTKAAFQAGADNGYRVLIVPLVLDNRLLKVDDMLLIYNSCILEHGHHFDVIIVRLETHVTQKTLREIADKVYSTSKTNKKTWETMLQSKKKYTHVTKYEALDALASHKLRHT